MPEIDRLILDAATGRRRLTDDELQRVLEQVARVGFDPNARERVRGRLAGQVWRSQVLRGSDLLPPAEVKYVWHVLKRREWPDGTTLEDYVERIRQVILDLTSQIFTSRYQVAWQLSVVRDSGQLRGPNGTDWILIEYRVETGHWVTAYQPHKTLEDELRNPKRDNLQWLRRQRPINR